MPLNIRHPRASELARDLALRRGTSMTKAIIGALENELTREKAKPPLAERVRQISSDLISSSASRRRKMTKTEINKMWGH
jgi:antitoxin VapB